MKSTLILIISGLCVLAGCSSMPQKDGETWIYADGPTLEQKKNLWDASLKVLNEYGIIRESVFDEGLLVVTSELKPQFGENLRMVISCKIIQDDEGYFEPLVRVMNQYDGSLTHLYKVSEEQPNYDWTTGSFNPKMEVEIYNKIMDLVERGKNKYHDSFPKSNPDRAPHREKHHYQATPVDANQEV